MQSGDDAVSLIVQVAAGDRAALKSLYEREGAKVMAISLRMLGRRDIAEEVVQDTFLSIWRAAKSFDPSKGSARSWIYVIARRRALDRLRASPWLKRETPEFTEGWAPSLSEDSLALTECLQQLDAKSRYAICICYLYGLTHEELSSAVGVPLGTLKSRIRRGLKSLRKCLSA